MSHIVTLQTRVHDPVAVAAACARLGLAPPEQGTARLFSGEATGLLIQLPDWRYPVVVDTITGLARYDDFGGSWGAPEHFNRFMQIYAVEKAKLAARAEGYTVSEQALGDGSIKVQIIEGRS